MSSNTSILTYNEKYFQMSTAYYSPTALLPVTGKPVASIYCFLSRVLPWADEDSPPSPTQDQKYIKTIHKNIFFMKRVTTNDMIPVIQRINWTSGSAYSYYRDDVNMFELDTNGKLVRRFYVKNRFDQVFKCLWNNNGEESTVEPYFQPGTFNANQVFQGADDYKWKYMYTITPGLKIKFMDETWMPVPLQSNPPNPTLRFAGAGSIDAINIIDQGSGYDEANAPVLITITGDGQFASANAVIDSGSIIDITVANTGSNYTYANVTISSTTGSGATAVAYPSPIGGNGFNPSTELGSTHLMITATFENGEAGKLPTDIDFRQVGIIVNPYAYFGTAIDVANSSTYSTSTDFVVSQGFGDFIPDETIYQSPDGTLENATFTGTVLSFDSTTNIVKVINTLGTSVNNLVLYGDISQTARVLLQRQSSQIIPYSGYIAYIDNRKSIARNPDGSEIFKLVLGY